MPDFLPELPKATILAALTRSPGNEVKSGKFDSPESSSALVVNGFGWFLGRENMLPAFPGLAAGPVQQMELEAEMRFPWSGGTHPWLDVGIETQNYLIGVESKRYEPFRPAKKNDFSTAYDRNVWGDRMEGYSRLRRTHANGARRFAVLDVVQLVKHAYGLRTQGVARGKRPVLLYLYAEPAHWANGRPVDPARIAQHRADLALFAQSVEGDEVLFAAMTWAELLGLWMADPATAAHAGRVQTRFAPL
jgi:hypothetical protein